MNYDMFWCCRSGAVLRSLVVDKMKRRDASALVVDVFHYEKRLMTSLTCVEYSQRQVNEELPGQGASPN